MKRKWSQGFNPALPLIQVKNERRHRPGISSSIISSQLKKTLTLCLKGFVLCTPPCYRFSPPQCLDSQDVPAFIQAWFIFCLIRWGRFAAPEAASSFSLLSDPFVLFCIKCPLVFSLSSKLCVCVCTHIRTYLAGSLNGCSHVCRNQSLLLISA